MIENRSAAPGPVAPRLVYTDVGQVIEWTFTQSVAGVAPEAWGGQPANPDRA